MDSVLQSQARAVTVEPADPQVVWALTSAGLDRSSDGDQTRETVSGMQGGRRAVCDPGRGGGGDLAGHRGTPCPLSER